MKQKRLSKRVAALATACCIAAVSCLSYAVYAYKNENHIPDWIQGSARDSWGKEVEEKARMYRNIEAKKTGIDPTNLGLAHASWNPGPTYEFPYTGVTYMDTVESGDRPAAGFESFNGKLIYCSTSHKVGADLRGGTQFFLENTWDENQIPDWIAGTGDEKKFNFYMMVCAIGMADMEAHKKGDIGTDVFGGVAPNYNGAAEFLATFPIVQQVEGGDGFNMTDIHAALEQYRNNVLVSRILHDAEQNPKVKDDLTKTSSALPDGRPTAMPYTEAMFVNVWRAAYACMALHSASPDYVYEITHEGDKKVVTVTCPFVPTDGIVAGDIYFNRF